MIQTQYNPANADIKTTAESEHLLPVEMAQLSKEVNAVSENPLLDIAAPLAQGYGIIQQSKVDDINLKTKAEKNKQAQIKRATALEGAKQTTKKAMIKANHDEKAVQDLLHKKIIRDYTDQIKLRDAERVDLSHEDKVAAINTDIENIDDESVKAGVIHANKDLLATRVKDATNERHTKILRDTKGSFVSLYIEEKGNFDKAVKRYSDAIGSGMSKDMLLQTASGHLTDTITASIKDAKNPADITNAEAVLKQLKDSIPNSALMKGNSKTAAYLKEKISSAQLDLAAKKKEVKVNLKNTTSAFIEKMKNSPLSTVFNPDDVEALKSARAYAFDGKVDLKIDKMLASRKQAKEWLIDKDLATFIPTDVQLGNADFKKAYKRELNAQVTQAVKSNNLDALAHMNDKVSGQTKVVLKSVFKEMNNTEEGKDNLRTLLSLPGSQNLKDMIGDTQPKLGSIKASSVLDISAELGTAYKVQHPEDKRDKYTIGKDLIEKGIEAGRSAIIDPDDIKKYAHLPSKDLKTIKSIMKIRAGLTVLGIETNYLVDDNFKTLEDVDGVDEVAINLLHTEVNFTEEQLGLFEKLAKEHNVGSTSNISSIAPLSDGHMLLTRQDGSTELADVTGDLAAATRGVIDDNLKDGASLGSKIGLGLNKIGITSMNSSPTIQMFSHALKNLDQYITEEVKPAKRKNLEKIRADLVVKGTAHTKTKVYEALDFIANKETGNWAKHYASQYDAVIGYKKSPKPISSMTLKEVMTYQSGLMKTGSPSTAVGKYQMLKGTLAETAERLHIPLRSKFDKATQEKMAVYLFAQKRKGSLKGLGLEWESMDSTKFPKNAAKLAAILR